LAPPRRYLLVLAGTLCLSLVLIAMWGLFGRDHFAAIRGPLGPTWYQDLGGAAVTEIQDQDLFLHDIGQSISALQHADVVIVGSSIAAFAIDGNLMRSELTDKFGLRFYNLSFVGISSGAFTREIIERHHIRPKLWIINADDGGGAGNFFGESLQRSFSANVKTIAATEHSRLTAMAEVVRRNLRWRFEILFAPILGAPSLESAARVPIPPFYRDAATGDADFSRFPGYDLPNNAPVRVKVRNEVCHTTHEVERIAQNFVAGIGDVVLTVIPNTYYCEQQAREVAMSLGVELVLTGGISYSSWDGGGHMDRRGGTAFTRDLLTALEASAAFQRIVDRNRIRE
jgi:hypothetical protein